MGSILWWMTSEKRDPFLLTGLLVLKGFWISFGWLTVDIRICLFETASCWYIFSRQSANIYYPFSRLIHDESLFLHIAAFIFSLTLLYAVFCQLCSKSSGQQPAEEWLKVHKCEVKLFLLCLIHRKIEKWESMNCNVM